MLTIFYDGSCPFCAKEMAALLRYDSSNSIELIDLHGDAWQAQFHEINFDAAMIILHGYQDGRLLKGLDVIAAAWKTVGKRPWLQSLRWPIVSWFADRFYIWFASKRYRMSWLLFGQKYSQSKSCTVKPKGTVSED